MVKRFLLAVVAGIWMAGCATTTASGPDAKSYEEEKGAFRGRWWSYYDRGAWSQAKESYPSAESDLRKAISGRALDSWNARTYGLHFVEYFPNRELGVTLYHLERLDEAEIFLNTSLQQIDTERAHYYLDLVKKAKLAKGDLNDAAAPAVGASLNTGAFLSTREIPLNIRASDDLGVSLVRLNGEQLHQRGSAIERTFQQNLLLEEGAHEITIDATDLSGKESSQTISVSVDITGPAIGIFEPPYGLVTDAASVKLRAAAADANGIASVKLGSQVLAEPKGAPDAEFQSELLLKDGANHFVIIATDAAGNETRSAVSVFKGTQQKTAAFLMGLPDRLLEPLRFAHVRFSTPARMFPALAGRLEAAQADAAQPAGPVAVLMNAPKEGAVTYRSELPVRGKVVAETKVSSIEYRSGDKTEKYTILASVAAPTVEFSKRIVMKQGPNPIGVAATDDQGRTAQQSVTVIGKPVAWEERESKMSLALIPFINTGGEDTVVQDLYRRTDTQILKKERFNNVERDQLDKILQELKLSAIANEEHAIRLGKLTQAQTYLFGEAITRGGAVELYVRAVDTETSTKVDQIDVHLENTSPEKLDLAARAVADWLLKRFPRVSGDLLSVTGKKLTLSFRKEEGVFPGMYVLVVHATESETKDPITDEVIKETDYAVLGRAKISEVTEKSSRAELFESKGTGKLELKPGETLPAVTM